LARAGALRSAVLPGQPLAADMGKRIRPG